MVRQELLDWAKAHKEKGYSKQQLADILIDHGYPEEESHQAAHIAHGITLEEEPLAMPQEKKEEVVHHHTSPTVYIVGAVILVAIAVTIALLVFSGNTVDSVEEQAEAAAQLGDTQETTGEVNIGIEEPEPVEETTGQVNLDIVEDSMEAGDQDSAEQNSQSGSFGEEDLDAFAVEFTAAYIEELYGDTVEFESTDDEVRITLSVENFVQDGCEDFNENLETCSPYSCEFIDETLGTVVQTIVGFNEEGYCVTTTESDISSSRCHYPEELRLEMVAFSETLVEANTIESIIDRNDFSQTLLVDGVQVEDISLKPLQEGYCGFGSLEEDFLLPYQKPPYPGACADYPQKLESCEPFTCETSEPFYGVDVRYEILGPSGDACMTRSGPATDTGFKTVCNLSETSVQNVVTYMNVLASGSDFDVDMSSGFTFFVDGVEVQDPESSNSDECRSEYISAE